MVKPVAETHKKPFLNARRIHIDQTSPTDIDHLFGGEVPLIIEGLDKSWPEEFQSNKIAAFLDPEQKLNSVWIAGKQVFGLTAKDFIDRSANAENVRVFGVTLAAPVIEACQRPQWLFDRMHADGVPRYFTWVPGGFIGAGGAITPLHYDFELNFNWHIALAGERTVYLWTDDQSHNLFKLPTIGLSLIPFSLGLLSYRYGQGYEIKLNAGELLYIPPRTWHQVEYDMPSLAITYGVHNSEDEQKLGYEKGKYWKGFMCYANAIEHFHWSALLSLPLMAPFFAFCVPYMLLGFLVKRLPELISKPALRALAFSDEIIYRIFSPLMSRFYGKYWGKWGGY